MKEGADFALKNDLLWFGETSCSENLNNVAEIFEGLLESVHTTQTDLVKQGLKLLADIKDGEEERTMTYNRCCY